MASPITQAIKQVCDEKGLSYEIVLAAIESALASAYRKDFGEKNQNIKIEFDPETGTMAAFDIKTVVEDMELEALEEKQEGQEGGEPKAATAVRSAGEQADLSASMSPEGGLGAVEVAEPEKPKFNPKTMVMISEAQKVKKDAVIGEEIKTELEIPGAFGRMAAQTAKQVITQKLREAERQTIFDEFKAKEGQIVSGIVGRTEGRLIFVDLGRATALFPPNEQIEREFYKPGSRLKFYLAAVNLTPKGPEIILSRARPEMLKQIFTLEIPEMQSGVVEIKDVAREAGSRSKVAVSSKVGNIDPIGACIGQRGTRIQTIIGELGGEKIDVIKWEEDPARFISNALAPAKTLGIKINEEQKSALVKVAPDQLSLAIGRTGQNVRLASILTGWRIAIEGYEEKKEAAPEVTGEAEEKIEDVPPVEKVQEVKEEK